MKLTFSRLLVLICLVAVYGVALGAGPGDPLGPESALAKRKVCGTYRSTSIYPRARVIAIRGVRCGRALRIARRYDRRFKQTGRWRCFLARAPRRPSIFSCGRGGRRGDVRDWPHALTVKGVRR